MLAAGTVAPTLVAPDHYGNLTSLSDFRGKWVLLWWYPKALTPGCTSCGNGFAKRLVEFRESGCEIVGVSYDTPERNRQFAERYRYPFPLLSATKGQADEWGAKRADDDDWAGIPRRISYLIDPDGRIAKAYRVADPSQHPERVLADVTALAQQAPKKRRRVLAFLR